MSVACSTPNLGVFAFTATLPPWYSRLGNPSVQVVKDVISKSSLSAVKSSFVVTSFCVPCHITKSHRLSFTHQHQHEKSANAFDFLFLDFWIALVLFFHGDHYFLFIIDD